MEAQMRLLVVEDTRPLAEYVSVACHAKGFVVDLAYSLSEARAAVAGTLYETIVLDLGLPDGDGLEWLQGDPTRWPAYSCSHPQRTRRSADGR